MRGLGKELGVCEGVKGWECGLVWGRLGVGIYGGVGMVEEGVGE